jgi:hypothetical protein
MNATRAIVKLDNIPGAEAEHGSKMVGFRAGQGNDFSGNLMGMNKKSPHILYEILVVAV